MDLLSDVIASVRAGRAEVGRASWRGRWGYRFPEEPNTAGFQVVLNGTGWLLPADPDNPDHPDDAGPVPLGAGDVLFAPRGAGYAIADSPTTPIGPAPEITTVQPVTVADPDRVEDPAGMQTLCGGYRLRPGQTHPLLLELPALMHVPAGAGRHREVRAAVDLLGAEVARPGPGADAVVTVLFDLLLLSVLRTWLTERPVDRGETGWVAALADPAIRTALDAIHREPAHPWSVRALAQRAGMSRAAFARRFTALTGRPPLSYLTWWRMTLAADLLRDHDPSLREIAERVGYGSEYAFAHAFKRHHGSPPGQFRKRLAST